MNLSELKTRVKRNLGNRTDIDDLITQWINACYLDLITTGKFPELGRFAPIPVPELDATTTFSTTNGTASYAFPADGLFPISMRDVTNDQPLKQRDIRWYDRHKTSATGKPLIYAIYGGYIYLEPTPDNT